MNLHQWSIDWGVPLAAVKDLQQRMGFEGTEGYIEGQSESAVQTQVRLEASEKGHRLWRNNLGAMQDEHGNFVRYGLANDSKQLNAHVKSGDLIGIERVLITPAHVGTYVGRFLSREVKPGGWRYAGTPREQAQVRWAEVVLSLGGNAGFATGRGTL